MQSKDVLFLPNLQLDLARISTKLSQRSKDSDSDGDSKDLCAFDRVCVPGPSRPSCGRQKHRQPEHVLKRLYTRVFGSRSSVFSTHRIPMW